MIWVLSISVNLKQISATRITAIDARERKGFCGNLNASSLFRQNTHEMFARYEVRRSINDAAAVLFSKNSQQHKETWQTHV